VCLLVIGGPYFKPFQCKRGWALSIPFWTDCTGSAAFVLGAFLLLTTYRASASGPGVPIASPLLVLFCDLILQAGGTFVLGLAMEALWVGPLGQTSLLGLESEWPSQQSITGLHFVSFPGPGPGPAPAPFVPVLHQPVHPTGSCGRG